MPMKTLSVQKTNNQELSKHWKMKVNFSGELFIRSNKKGEVNWDKAPVYRWEEILEEQKRRRVIFTIPPNYHQLGDY